MPRLRRGGIVLNKRSNEFARVVQWQNTSFPSWIWGFDSPLSLHLFMNKLKRRILRYVIVGAALILAGCASVPPTIPPKPLITRPGFYHKVERGQTLWRISRMYDVDINELAEVNRISDTTAIEVGQMIFVPQDKQKPVCVIVGGNQDFIWPTRGKVIAAFNTDYNTMLTKGINIQPSGEGNVVASRSGTVVFYSENFSGFGKTLIIDHGDGFTTVYARNSTVLVKLGDQVAQGALIGRAGVAGRDKGRYLHFEIRKGALAQNPYFYLPQ